MASKEDFVGCKGHFMQISACITIRVYDVANEDSKRDMWYYGIGISYREALRRKEEWPWLIGRRNVNRNREEA